MNTSNPRSPLPWHRLSRRILQKTIVFDLLVDRLRSPRNGAEDDFYLIDIVDWVNVIALTPQCEVILVEQYRFGAEVNSLELPGGMLGSRDEDPQEAALRELEEETGYRAEKLLPLGMAHPNPAIQTNRCFFYFAPQSIPVGTFSQDHLEDIAIHLVPLSDIPQLIREERITHALMVSAFMRLVATLGPDVFQRTNF